jgi:uncharacterized membrane protein YgdD (TMEM256/DUF423 family)
MSKSPFIALGAILAFLAVALGAFGAHGLKNILSVEQLAIYRTAVDYHMWHSLGLILIGLVIQQNNSKLLSKAGWIMFAGVIIFSGSLYALSLTGISMLGAITPIGGVCFLVAWASVAYAFITSK